METCLMYGHSNTMLHAGKDTVQTDDLKIFIIILKYFKYIMMLLQKEKRQKLTSSSILFFLLPTAGLTHFLDSLNFRK